jgi:serine/threonine-protein kinase
MGADPAGRRVARYEITRELGRGGMGVVYLAEQPSLGRHVVLKALQSGLDDDPREVERFEREAQAVAAVHHPNVVAVYDCFRFRGRLFIAQEYVDGADLASVVARVGAFAPRIGALVALEIARGLEEIHGRGLVHRDLKPANVMLGRKGEVKIADFGVALDARGHGLTRTGTALGTPAYMSPEQIQGARLDFRSDLFSFGALTHQLVSGELPYGEPGDEAEPLLQRIEKRRPRSLRRAAPGTPRGLARAVRRTLEHRSPRRARSTSELRRRLERALGSPSPADARAEIADWLAERKAFPGREGRTRRRADRAEAPRRRRLGRIARVATLACVLAAALLGVGWIAIEQSHAPGVWYWSAPGPSAPPRPAPDAAPRGASGAAP